MNLRLAAIYFAILMGVASAPAASFSFLVKVSGKGRPVILIPGLGCGPEVWNSTISHFDSKYEFHVLTLPGFAGQPAIKGPILSRVRDEITDYIKTNHLDHPVIIGHSLGATLAFWVASRAPKLLGGVIAVDGVPWLPALMDPTIDTKVVAAQGTYMSESMARMDKKAFRAATKRSLTSMISDPKDVEWVLNTSAESDPTSVGRAMAEMYATDLRNEVKNIQCPVLLLAEGAFFNTPSAKTQALANYESQIHLVPKHVVRMSTKARHFIMLDDPVFFFDQVGTFLTAQLPN